MFRNINLKQIFYLGIDNTNNEFDNLRIWFINAVVIFRGLMSYIDIFIHVINKNLFLTIIDVTIFLLAITTLYLNYHKKLNAAKVTSLVFMVSVSFLYALFLPKSGNEYYIFPILLAAVYSLNKRINFFLIALYYLILILLTKIIAIYKIQITQYTNFDNSEFYKNAIAATIFMASLAFISVKEKYRLLSFVEATNNKLKEQNDLVANLLRELNHRVKNNLQLTSSLFNIQANKSQNADTKDALNDAKHRIASLGILHQKLYKEELIFDVILIDYLEDLCNYLIQSAGVSDKITFSIHSEKQQLPIHETVHLGLIINELVTNSLKYGFTNTEQGKILIKIEIIDKESDIRITYKDNGSGFPENFSINNYKSFGIDLIKTIVDQYDGKLKTYNNDGAVTEMTLKFSQ